MSENPDTPPLITSLLWKASLLAHESTNFARLVRAAADHQGKKYTEHMRMAVAADEDIVQAIELPLGEGVDSVLESFATDPEAGQQIDTLISAAVNAYTPLPPDEPNDPEGA